MNFLHLAQRHQKNPVVPKSHHLGLQARQPRGADLADISEGNIRPDRFYHEACHLHYLSHANHRRGGIDAPAQVLHEGGKDRRLVVHFNERATFWSFVKTLASIMPKRLLARQSPGKSSGSAVSLMPGYLCS